MHNGPDNISEHLKTLSKFNKSYLVSQNFNGIFNFFSFQVEVILGCKIHALKILGPYMS